MSKAIRIIFVDDDFEDRYFIQYAFKQIGCDEQIKILQDHHTLLAYLSAIENPEHHPDLVAVDLRMPEVSGFQMLQLLKGDLRYKDIPVVVFSDRMTPELSDSLQVHGALACYSKPDTLERMVQWAEAIQALAQTTPLKAIG